MNNRELIQHLLTVEKGKPIMYQLIDLKRMYTRFKLEKELELIHDDFVCDDFVCDDSDMKSLEIHVGHKIQTEQFESDVYNVMVGICANCK